MIGVSQGEYLTVDLISSVRMIRYQAQRDHREHLLPDIDGSLASKCK
jgi:hypothetical protein